MEKMPDKPPEGSWQTEVPLGCAIPMGICSCPIGKDKHLAVAVGRQALTVMKT